MDQSSPTPGWPEVPKIPASAAARLEYEKILLQGRTDATTAELAHPLALAKEQQTHELALVKEQQAHELALAKERQAHDFALAKEQLAHSLALVKEQRAHDLALVKDAAATRASRLAATQANEYAMRQAAQTAYIEVGKGIIDRSMKRAEYVTGAAGTIATAYGLLLGVKYSAAVPIRASALAPSVFLGLAFFLGAVYIAFLRRTSFNEYLLPGGIGTDIETRRLTTFLRWVSATVIRRSWALRSAVVSLGIGVALLPLPFLGENETRDQRFAAAAALVLVAWVAIDSGAWAHLSRSWFPKSSEHATGRERP